MFTFLLLIGLLLLSYNVNSGFVRDLPQLNTEWQQLYSKSDWKNLQDLYWTDCVIMPQNAPSLFGHDAVLNIFKAAKESGIEKIELYTGAAKQITFDNGIDRGRYLFFNKDNIIIDEGKYITNWQRFNDEEKKYPWKLKIHMFSSNIIHQSNHNNKLEIDNNIINQWTEKFLKCWSSFNGVQCRNIVNDDIFINDLVIESKFDKDGFIQYINNNYKISKREIINKEIEKIAQNKAKISFVGNFEMDKQEKKVNGEIIVCFDLVTGQVWKIDIDYKFIDDDNNKIDL